MNKRITFGIDDPGAFTSDTDTYLIGQGFTKVSVSDNTIAYKKGSVLLNMVTFNPLNWKSTVTIVLKDNIADAIFDITTIGQMVTPKEEATWDMFVENYKVSIVSKVNLAEVNMQQLKATTRNNLDYIKWAIGGGVVFGIPSGVIAYFTGWHNLAGMGAAIGAIIFIMMRMKRDEK